MAGSKERTVKEMREMLVDAWIICFRPGVGGEDSAECPVPGSPTISSPRVLAGTAVPGVGESQPMRATDRPKRPR